MKFVMPDDPEIQLGVFQAMLVKVEGAILKIPDSFLQIDETLRQAQESGDVQNLREAYANKVELRRQELCLIDQKRRLEERIDLVRERLEIQ